MRLFIDSADLEEIKACLDTGLIAGLTTNPVLLSRSTTINRALLKDICTMVPGKVSLQVVAEEEDNMRAQAKFLADIADNVVLKLPLTETGLKICREVTEQGSETNVTFCFSAIQALLAARAGATYVSPFMGRLDSIGGDGEGLIQDIQELFIQHDLETETIAASIRTVDHVIKAALAGSDIATLPPKIFWELFKHPLTDQALESVRPHRARIEADLFKG